MMPIDGRAGSACPGLADRGLRTLSLLPIRSDLSLQRLHLIGAIRIAACELLDPLRRVILPTIPDQVRCEQRDNIGLQRMLGPTFKESLVELSGSREPWNFANAVDRYVLCQVENDPGRVR